MPISRPPRNRRSSSTRSCDSDGTSHPDSNHCHSRLGPSDSNSSPPPPRTNKKAVKDVASEKTKEAKRKPSANGKTRWLRWKRRESPPHRATMPLRNCPSIRNISRPERSISPNLQDPSISAPNRSLRRWPSPRQPATAQEVQSARASHTPLAPQLHKRRGSGSGPLAALCSMETTSSFRREAGSKDLWCKCSPARYLSRNGQLRVVFHELVPPDGLQQKIEASLEGVQSGKDQNSEAGFGRRCRSPDAEYSLSSSTPYRGRPREPLRPVTTATHLARVDSAAQGASNWWELRWACRSLAAAWHGDGSGWRETIYLRSFPGERTRCGLPKDIPAMEIGMGARQEPPPAAQPSAPPDTVQQ